MTVLKVKNASNVFEDIPAIKGGQGYYVNNVYKKSGTGAAGTTDVYGMKINDTAQTEVGTFNVYNGADGQGSGDLSKFVYDYETTTYDELKSAVDAGKVIYVQHAYTEEPEEGEDPEYVQDFISCFTNYHYLYETTIVLAGIMGDPVASALGIPGVVVVVFVNKDSETGETDKTCLASSLFKFPDSTASSVTSSDKFVIQTGTFGEEVKKLSIDKVKAYVLNNLALSSLTDDSTHRLVTDTEKSTWNGKANTSDIPTKTSELTNDSGFLTSHQSLSAYRTSAAQDVIDAGKENAGKVTISGTERTVVTRTLTITDSTGATISYTLLGV